MKRKAKALGLICFMVFCFSCSNVWKNIGSYNNYVDSFEFKNGKTHVEKDDICICYVSATPSDSFDYLELSFEITDENIAVITDKGKNYCMVKGVKEGSTVLTAMLGNSSCKTVVTVR